jgi:hypothetical protein
MAREVTMSSTGILGTRLLREIESEEGNLEDVSSCFLYEMAFLIDSFKIDYQGNQLTTIL